MKGLAICALDNWIRNGDQCNEFGVMYENLGVKC